MTKHRWLVGAATLGLLACSEDTITSGTDALKPTTAVIFPVSTADRRIDVSESIDVFVTAKDNIGVSKLEIWTASESDDEPDLLAEMTEPTPTSQIPDSLRRRRETPWVDELVRLIRTAAQPGRGLQKGTARPSSHSTA